MINISAGAMRRSNILCKSLSTVETLGAVNVIASDKTGTLTQNKMAPINIAIGLDQYSVTEARERTLDGEKVGNSIRILAAVAGLCNDSEFDLSDKYTSLENMKINGDATGSFSSACVPLVAACLVVHSNRCRSHAVCQQHRTYV
jgi:sodium/potassium-transporting ATPase subunit alpha